MQLGSALDCDNLRYKWEYGYWVSVKAMVKGAQANFSPTKKTDTLCKLSYY